MEREKDKGESGSGRYRDREMDRESVCVRERGSESGPGGAPDTHQQAGAN